MKNEGEFAVIMIAGAELQNRLEGEIALLDFVIERNVVLRKLEFAEAAFFGDDFAQDVESGENPAAARGAR
jgi:hypothetical protein